MAVTKAQVRKVLKASKEVIADPRNWYKGDFYNVEMTRFCAAGAIQKIDTPAEQDAYKALARAIVRRNESLMKRLFTIKGKNGNWWFINHGVHSVAEWVEADPIAVIAAYNDSRTRKHEDIMAAFDEAIESV